MSLKDKLKKLLQDQVTLADSIKADAENATSLSEIQKVLQAFSTWDNLNKLLLDKGIEARQLSGMYNKTFSLGHNEDDKASFKYIRWYISNELTHKLPIIKMTLSQLEVWHNKDLLPLDDVLPNNQSLTQTLKNMKKVFISHAFADNDKVLPLVDLLQGIGLSPDQIFYSSHPAFGVKPGENILERLKSELNSTDLVLFILSENFYKSPVCLCEMGAAWIKTSRHIPILIPPFGHSDIKGAIPTTVLSLKINNATDISSLIHEVETEFSLKPIHKTLWDQKRDKYIKEISVLVP